MTERAETMRALRLPDHGGPEDLVLERMPVPAAAIGDALIGVHVASFTPDEHTWPPTWIDRAGRRRAPSVPGHEVSGTVVALGSGTTGLSVGDAVYGLTDWYRDGSAAEYVAVEARNLAAKPDALDHAEAATFAMGALTADQALFRHGGLQAGQTVVILGAGGGVGTIAVQLAHAAGARVVATGRASDRELVSGLGADVFVDVERDRLEDAGPAAVVFDAAGGELLERSWVLVRPGGTVVSIVAEPSHDAARERSARGVYFIVEPDGAALAQLDRLVEACQLRPVVGVTMPLERGREAWEAKARGGVPGKVALEVAA